MSGNMWETMSDGPVLEHNQKSARFVHWFGSAGGTRLSGKIELADTGYDMDDRGVFATQDLNEDEELFAIPRQLVLTASTSSIPQDVLTGLDDRGSWPPLIVAIIYEFLKFEDSSWYPYFQVLPTRFHSLMHWNELELEELQGSAVLGKIGRAGAESEWRETIIPVMLRRPDLFPLDGHGVLGRLSSIGLCGQPRQQDQHNPAVGAQEASKIAILLTLAHMAGSLIMAYAFDIDRDEDTATDEDFREDDEDEPLKGMVPFADMLNADADLNNARLFQEDDFLVMKAIKPVKAGEQLFNDYGPLPRSDLLRMYGYITSKYTQYDVVEFSHDLLVDVAGMRDPSNNSAWQKREEQLDEIGIIDDGYAITRPSDGDKLEDSVPGNVHMLLRGLTLGSRTLKQSDLGDDQSISINEAALLSAVATKRLTEYPTSLEQDRQIAADPASYLRPNMTLRRFEAAVQVRSGEKEILHRVIELCQTFIADKTKEIASNDKKRKHDSTDDPKSKKALKKNGKR